MSEYFIWPTELHNCWNDLGYSDCSIIHQVQAIQTSKAALLYLLRWPWIIEQFRVRTSERYHGGLSVLQPTKSKPTLRRPVHSHSLVDGVDVPGFVTRGCARFNSSGTCRQLSNADSGVDFYVNLRRKRSNLLHHLLIQRSPI